ncbi:hypothetical protein KY290_027798 [Solanum tuberosum]|uniref:START domain-containing protein n=1 Tax=Solanum tuberosum TaxID=4113 RepID=A0ABQ7UHX3_SOLTU|nr:hypothetical protein KY290_027798 [Solanum tuberosum]
MICRLKPNCKSILTYVSVGEVQFLRFCKKHVEGVWAIVDVSVDTIQEGSQESEIKNCRRLPSGCILQDMPNGYCQGETVDSNISFFFPHEDDSGVNQVILQDTCMDATGSLLVDATIDSQEINTVMKGGGLFLCDSLLK